MLTPRWRKVIRDLWGNKTKTVLVVLAIAVGLFAFGSVFITQEIMVTGMNSEYRAVNSSGIIFHTQPFDDNLLRWVRQQPEVADAQGMASYVVKMFGGNKTYNLTLIAFEDNNNITMNRITPEQGAWPPARKEIVFERTSLPLTTAEIGDTVTLETSNGRSYELNISGTVHDLNAFPGSMVPLPTAFVSRQTLEWLGFSGQCNQIHITAVDSTGIPALEKTASALKERLQEKGFPIYSTQVRDPREHWARTTTESFSLILFSLGIFTLILSAFLVVNTITALVTQQKRQIGIMKAVGGMRKQIISLYLVLVSFYGLLALLIALPISLGLGYIFVNMVANLLNLDIVNFHLPVKVLLLEIGAAVLVPAVAAALPILGGVKITVREALSDYGIAGKSRASLFDRVLYKVRLFSRPMLLSLRNTFRRKSRLALTLGTLTLAGVLFIGVLNVRSSLDAEFSNMFDKYWDWEIALELEGNYPVRGTEARVLNIPGVTGVESQTVASAQRIKDDGSRSATFTIYGVPPDSDYVKPDVTGGRWLQKGDRNVLVVTSALMEDMPDARIGDDIVLRLNGEERAWRIVGSIPQKWEKAAYTDFSYLSRTQGTPGLTSSLYLRTEQKDGDSQAAMAETVEQHLKKSGIKVGSSITQETIVSSNAGQVDFLI